jgi:hypothetical protein
MHTPSAAFAWELWRRHRVRLLAIIGLVLGFALVYPRLCALAGFNINGRDVLDEVARKFELAGGQQISAQRIVLLLCALALACGPALAMFLTLVYVAWMFTFTALNPKTKDPMTFPERVFTLPVSTPFLFWWLFLAGQAAVIALFCSWVHFVRLPHLDIFAAYQNCFGWMTLLVLAQGIVWALAAWPVTRMLILSVAFFCFTFSPARRDIFESPLVLPPLFILGLVLARKGLHKMRHGQWQGWNWEETFSKVIGRSELRGPGRFASPAQAQLWFEWRRFARHLFFYVAALIVAPLLLHLLARIAFGLKPLQDNTMCAFAVYMVAIPLIVHFCSAISPARTDLPFLMLRPVTNGAIMMATLKAAAISTMVSWVVALAALCAMPLLGNFHAVEKSVAIPPEYRVFGVLGLIFLTWRMIAVTLCFVWSGNRRLAEFPAFAMVAAIMGGIVVSWLANNTELWGSFILFVPGLLACLVAVKFVLAFLSLRLSFKKGLLAPSDLVGYLVVWILLVAVLLATLLVLSHPSKELILPASLAIVLLVPLARIGLCPITLAWNRHS